jgi:hypothetical protein
MLVYLLFYFPLGWLVALDLESHAGIGRTSQTPNAGLSSSRKRNKKCSSVLFTIQAREISFGASNNKT